MARAMKPLQYTVHDTLPGLHFPPATPSSLSMENGISNGSSAMRRGKQKNWLHKGGRRCFSKQADPPILFCGKWFASWTFLSSFQCSNDNSLFGSLCGTREIGQIGMAKAPLSICSGDQKELFCADSKEER
ncbi:unnamed protein product [Boreogadus saida]